MTRFLTLVFTLMVCGVMADERPRVEARIVPDSIGIGDRCELVIEVDRDVMQVVAFPEFKPGEQLELIENCAVDTLAQDGRRIRLRKRYLLQAFENGRYNMGRAQVLYIDKNIVDTLRSEGDSLRLQVGTFQIDSTSQSIYDVKAQKELPFVFAEIKTYFWWGLALLVLIAVAVVGLVRWLAKRGKRLGDLFKPAPQEPPHVVAIKELEKLHNQKLWQNNKHKLYYSSLTDILRTYIAGRWGITAMEMTSDEILRAIRREDLPDKAAMDLRSVLQDADLVKFAKFAPDADANDADYYKVYYFVEQTKEQEEGAEVDPDEMLQNKN